WLEVVGGLGIKFGEILLRPSDARLGALSPDLEEAKQHLEEFACDNLIDASQPFGKRALEQSLCKRVEGLTSCSHARTPENRVLPNIPKMLAEHRATGKVTILTGFDVQRLVQDQNGAGIFGLHHGEPSNIRAKLVLVGAGVDGSAQLFLNSFPG